MYIVKLVSVPLLYSFQEDLHPSDNGTVNPLYMATSRSDHTTLGRTRKEPAGTAAAEEPQRQVLPHRELIYSADDSHNRVQHNSGGGPPVTYHSNAATGTTSRHVAEAAGRDDGSDMAAGGLAANSSGAPPTADDRPTVLSVQYPKTMQARTKRLQSAEMATAAERNSMKSIPRVNCPEKIVSL